MHSDNPSPFSILRTPQPLNKHSSEIERDRYHHQNLRSNPGHFYQSKTQAEDFSDSTRNDEDLRGELTTCKDEMTNLKEEIKKFNQVMRDQMKGQTKLEWESSPLKMTTPSKVGFQSGRNREHVSSNKKYSTKERASSKKRGLTGTTGAGTKTSKYQQKTSYGTGGHRNRGHHQDPKNQVLINYKVHSQYEMKMKKQAMSLDNYERRIGAFTKNIAYVRSMNQCENRRRKKEYNEVQKKLEEYLGRTDELLRENLTLKNENNLGAESLIESEKRINKLKKEIEILRKNQMTLKEKEGKRLKLKVFV